jgi:transcriptional regulator with XRE-family HTH domain
MRSESEVWQALLRRKGLSVTDLASKLGVTRQHAHRLLTGRRPAESQREELEQALALGRPAGGSPLFAVGELDDNGELDLVPAGDAQPLFADRDLAGDVARALEPASLHVCVVPVWPEYAWRNLVAFHAAWGMRNRSLASSSSSTTGWRIYRSIRSSARFAPVSMPRCGVERRRTIRPI